MTYRRSYRRSPMERRGQINVRNDFVKPDPEFPTVMVQPIVRDMDDYNPVPRRLYEKIEPDCSYLAISNNNIKKFGEAPVDGYTLTRNLNETGITHLLSFQPKLKIGYRINVYLKRPE